MVNISHFSVPRCIAWLVGLIDPLLEPHQLRLLQHIDRFPYAFPQTFESIALALDMLQSNRISAILHYDTIEHWALGCQLHCT